MNIHSDSDDESHRRETAEHLRFAITDHQETIRAIDLKSEVLGIVLTVLLAVAEWEGHISASNLRGKIGVVAAAAALVAFLLIGCVLWPRSDPWRRVLLGGYSPSRVLYPPTAKSPDNNVAARAQRALTTDWVSELTFELGKLACIRDSKRFWFRGALVLSAIAVLAVGIRLFVPECA